MQYEKHDFKKNITGAIKAGDSNKVIEILMSEVGRVLATDKPALIQAVKKSGKDLPDNIDDKALLRVITSGILNQNKTFLNNLTQTLLLESQEYSNVDIGGILGGIGGITQGIGNAVSTSVAAKEGTKSAKEGTKQAQEATKQAQQAMMGQALASKNQLDIARLEAETRRTESGERTKLVIKVTAILGGVAILGIIGFVIYKSRQGGDSAAAGASAS